MATPPDPNRRGPDHPTVSRDDALVRLSRATKTLGVASVTAVGGLSAYVAHAVPGSHTTPASARTQPTAPAATAPPSTASTATAPTDPTSPATAPAATTPATTARHQTATTSAPTTLSPPTTAPRRTYSPPQTVSGATHW